MLSGLIYLAAPYSAPDPKTVEARMDSLARVQANLVS